MKEGEIDILIGTHALIQGDVEFENRGLVVTDEQHRFGDNQRRVLREKGGSPDVLFMTATPIPRTLAITVFGEMDVSIIDEMPAGRKAIETYWAKEDMLTRQWKRSMPKKSSSCRTIRTSSWQRSKRRKSFHRKWLSYREWSLMSLSVTLIRDRKSVV